jgi:hypothetical protein
MFKQVIISSLQPNRYTDVAVPVITLHFLQYSTILPVEIQRQVSLFVIAASHLQPQSTVSVIAIRQVAPSLVSLRSN